MDVNERLAQLTTMVRNAKAMPMSASCLVNRAEMLDLLARLREELPADLDHADALLADREAVLGAGREQAERLVEAARAEREQLIEENDVLVAARARATTLTLEARAESIRLLSDADDYVDRKLAEFDDLLGQLASQVNNGRLRLTIRREADLARFQGADPERADESVDSAAWSPEPGAPPEQGAPASQDPQGPAQATLPVGA